MSGQIPNRKSGIAHPLALSAFLRAVFILLALGALSPSSLAIGRPPAFVTQPTNQLVAVGSDVTLSVTVSSPTPPSFQWQKEAAALAGQTNASLVLTNVQLRDGGTYCVVVQNAGGSVTSSNATLYVVSVASQSVSLGADVSFSVAATPALPASNYQWRHNGADIPGATLSVLAITNVQLADAGVYSVLVANPAGSATPAGTLDVDPTFTKTSLNAVIGPYFDVWSAAWADYDNDSQLDLFLTTGGGNDANILLRNNRNGTFTRMTTNEVGSVVGDVGPSSAAAWGDYDNDGFLDLLVGNDPGTATRLYRNNANGTFARLTTNQVGNIALALGGAGAAAWADYDNDGFLDVFLAYSAELSRNRLFRNNRDGTFSEVADSVVLKDVRVSQACAWADYDNDGRLDLLVSRYAGAEQCTNTLYHNEGKGVFTQVTQGPVVTNLVNGRGVAWGDYDNDGSLDLYVINRLNYGTGLSYLYHNNGDGTFTSVTNNALVSSGTWWDATVAWGDYDNDGFLDLFVAHGQGRNRLYRNNGDGTFTKITTGSLVNESGYWRLCSWADYNNDGFLDLYVGAERSGGPQLLYHNNGNSNGWLKLKCVGTLSNRAGIGAKARVKALIRGAYRWQLREIITGDGRWNTPPPEAHFGLGDATNVDLLRIEWPSGIVQELRNRALKQSLTVTEAGAGILPYQQVLLPGSNQTFQAASTLGGALTYQWQYYSADLPGETNATLTITNAQLANAGEYTVVVRTAEGAQSQTSAPALLTALGPPIIRTQPQSQIAAAGTDVTFTVGMVPSATPLAFQWIKIAGGQWPLPGQTNASLVLTNVRPNDGATYSVFVSNADTNITSDVAGLTVVRDACISASLGGNATLQVNYSGPAPLSYQWRFNGLDIPGATTNKYVLTNAQPANVGEYSVVVRNAAGSFTNLAPALVVDPTFTKTSLDAIIGAVADVSRAAWADYDNDGHLDLFLTTAGGSDANVLLRNNGDGTFTKLTTNQVGSVVGDCGASYAAAWGDYNNDGFLDLLVGNGSGTAAWLYRNNGDGTFTRLTAKDVGSIALFSSVTGGAAWADYDNDGFLDVFLASGDALASNRLFHNNGDGTLSNLTASVVVKDVRVSRACAWGDYDNDGRLDLLVTRDSQTEACTNTLYHNEGNGIFTQVTQGPVATDVASSRGAAWGDYDNDGFLDLFVVNWAAAPVNYLYHNNGDGTFTSVTKGAAVSDRSGFATAAWGDYDNDGFLDLFVANGSGSNCFYRNNGDGTFTKITTGSLVNESGSHGPCSWADYDNDGFLDLYVGTTGSGGPQLLYHNNGNSNGWLKLKCVGALSNRAGIGAKARVRALIRGAYRWELREITTGDGRWNTPPPEAHFGLGDATNVDLLRIEWPSGIVQDLPNVATNQFLTVTEPDLSVSPKSVAFDGTATVTFTASTTITSPQFQWLFQGNALAGETKDWLTVSNLTALKAGKYTVVVSRAGTAETASASGVIEPVVVPAIAQQPQSLTVEPGSAATFVVTASGSPPLAYQWLRNGEPIAGATNASFQVSQVQPADAGEYVVVVSNPGGEVRSASALLSLVGAPKIVVQPKDQSVSLGASATFSVVPDGTPPFNYQWRFNGTDIAGANSSALNLLAVSLADAGSFSVVVSNALGQVTSTEAVLSVDATFGKVTTGGLAGDLGHYHGQAWGDYDNDGHLDLLMLGLEPAQDAIFRNNGDGTFTKLHPSPWERAASPFVWAYGWGDYDNDGWLDLFFGDMNPKGEGTAISVLLRNNGAGGFTSMGPCMGLLQFSGAWADYDRDGLLDLASAGFGPGSVNAIIRSYRNQGNGTFDVETLAPLGIPGGYVAPAWVDLDNDGWPDLFATHYGGNNAVFLNLGDGTFAKLTEGDLVNDPARWMASAWGDYNNDGNLDVFVTATEGQNNTLYRNDGHGVFKKMTAAEVGSLVADGGDSWGCAWGDYDNDGWLDLFVANADGQGNFLYHNNGDGTFTRVTSGSLANDVAESITCNWVDYDQDGFLDLFVQNHAWPCAPGMVTTNFLYHNSTNSNHWLAVKCVGALSPRDGTGATVRLNANIGGRSPQQMRVIDVGGTWFGGLSFVAHFGLGDAPRAETVRVEWPSGMVDEFSQVSPNRYLTIKETVINLSASASDPWPGQSVTLHVTTPLPGASYQWRRDGQAIAGATGTTLELTNVSAADIGDYTVVATRWDSDLGAAVATVSRPVHLELKTKPIVGAPTFEPGSVSLGAEVTVQAAVSGSPPFSYQWQFNQSDLPGQTNSVLNLTNAQLSDAGFYRLVVTNAAGETVGPEARLEVDTTFTKITSGPIVTNVFFQICHAWVDYDSDGDLDLAIMSSEFTGGPLPLLGLVIYRNDGNGVFTRQSQAFPVQDPIGTLGSWGDYDNDGYPDVFRPVSGQPYGYPGNNDLLHNQGNGTFRQVTNSVPAQEGGLSTAAAWGDYNRDGWLDLYVANSAWFSFALTNWLYLNQGNGAFLKLTPEQVGAPLQDMGVWGLPSWADVDDDGWPDLLVNNAGGAAQLYRNTGTGSFVSVAAGPLATQTNWWGCAWGDYDNDGKLDLLMTNPGVTNALFRNEGGWVFRKMTEAEVGPLVTDGDGWGCAWGDYDNDGCLDVFVPKGAFAAAKSSLFHNNGDGTFTRVTTGSPANDIGYANACDWVDYDQDGALDLFVFEQTWRPDPDQVRRPRLYRNNGNTNHWLVVKCVGTSSPRLGTGAKVRALATIRGKPMWQLRLIDAGGTACSGLSYYAHFGLGDATKVDLLRIQWPSGIVQELRDVAVGQYLTVTEPAPVRMARAGELGIQCWLGMQFRVEASSDLVNWTPLATVTNVTGSLMFTDPGAASLPRRFYRVVGPVGE